MRRRPERGSGSLLAVGLALCLLGVAAGSLTAASVAGSAHQARAAADLAAVAGATAEAGAPGRGCAVAASTAAANGARLTSCAASTGGELRLVASVNLRVRWPGLPPAVRASSRAGPAP